MEEMAIKDADAEPRAWTECQPGLQSLRDPSCGALSLVRSAMFCVSKE